MKRARALLTFALLGAPAPAAATKIALLEVTAEGGADPEISSQLTNRLAGVLASRPGVEVIAPDDIRAMLEREATLQMLGCEEDSCLVELGGALGADLIVKGRVAKLDAGYAVSLSAVDPTAAEARGRASQTWGGPSIGLLGLMAPMVDLLLPPDDGPLEGGVEVTGAPDGAQILIDDRIRGTAPAGRMGKVAIGAREVRVVAEGYQPWSRWVVVARGETTTVPATLSELEGAPFYATWWFWTAAGLAVAGAATGAALALSGGGDGPGGATGVNVSVNADTAFTGGRR